MKIQCIILGKPTPQRMVIAVTTNDTIANISYLVLRYRQRDQQNWTDTVGEYCEAQFKRDFKHIHFWLKDLKPATTYEYQILYKGKFIKIEEAKGEDDDREQGNMAFTTPQVRNTPEANQPFDFCVGGDQEEIQVLIRIR